MHSAHDQADRPAGVSAKLQRLAPTVLQGNRPSWGLWSARNSQQFRARAARRALRKRVASWGFWGGQAGGQLHGRAGAGASSLHFWGQLIAFLGVSPGREPGLVQADRDLGVRQSAPREASHAQKMGSTFNLRFSFPGGWRLAQAPQRALSSGSSMEDLGRAVQSGIALFVKGNF